MMGRELSDPHGVEQGGSIKGMALLPLRTIFGEMKVRSRINGAVLQITKGIYEPLSESTFSGYEIHMGVTESLREVQRFSEISYLDGSGAVMDGYVSGHCMGSYVHGMFESGTLRNSLLQLLFDRKGLVWRGKKETDYLTYKNSQYDLIAEIVRENTDMKAIYHMIGLS